MPVALTLARMKLKTCYLENQCRLIMVRLQCFYEKKSIASYKMTVLAKENSKVTHKH